MPGGGRIFSRSSTDSLVILVPIKDPNVFSGGMQRKPWPCSVPISMPYIAGAFAYISSAFLRNWSTYIRDRCSVSVWNSLKVGSDRCREKGCRDGEISVVG